MEPTRETNDNMNNEVQNNETKPVSSKSLKINGPGVKDSENVYDDEMMVRIMNIPNSDLLTLDNEQISCMKRVMSMDGIEKGDKISGLKYTSTWRELIGLIEQLFITASPKEKSYSEYFIERIGVWLGAQCLDNPYIYVSHGPNHSFEVVGYLD